MTDSWLGIIGAIVLGTYTMFRIWKLAIRLISGEKSTASRLTNEKTQDAENKGLEQIIPLKDFDWKITEPLKFRTFKEKYHLTMGISTFCPSSLLTMDKNYLTRLHLRQQIMAEHPDTAIQAALEVKSAVDELYTYLVTTYLPTRFPRIFTLSPSTHTLLNTATSLSLPLSPSTSPEETFKLLGANLDEEFLILMEDEKTKEYVLRGYVTCFPSGFDTREKFGRTLGEIHGPVPGYKEKLEVSMERFFGRLEVGKVVGRSNWSVTTHDRLFAAHGNHLYEGDSAQEEEINISNTYLRCERQMLHRLPQTKALVFNFKTYMYPLQEIKEEGLGEELATAIEGLKEGSVPAMYFYKRGVVWGEAVKRFLRS